MPSEIVTHCNNLDLLNTVAIAHFEFDSSHAIMLTQVIGLASTNGNRS